MRPHNLEVKTFPRTIGVKSDYHCASKCKPNMTITTCHTSYRVFPILYYKRRATTAAIAAPARPPWREVAPPVNSMVDGDAVGAPVT